MRLVASILLGLAASIRETLPSDDREGGVFVAGLAWAFVVQWVLLIAVTYVHCRTTGAC